MLINNLTAQLLTHGPDEVYQADGGSGPGYNIYQPNPDPYHEMRQQRDQEGPQGWPYNPTLPSWHVWGQGLSATIAKGRENCQNVEDAIQHSHSLPGMGDNGVYYDIWSPQIYQRGLAQPLPTT